METKVELGE